MKHLIHNLRIKLGLYDLRKEGAKWVNLLYLAKVKEETNGIHEN